MQRFLSCMELRYEAKHSAYLLSSKQVTNDQLASLGMMKNGLISGSYLTDVT